MVSGERATFFQGFCFFFLSLDFFYFLFFFIPQSEKKRGRDSFFLCTSVLAEGALLGFKRERIFHALEKGRIFFFLLSRGRFSFFFEFSIGSAQGNSSSQCASRGNVARREIKKNDPSSFFFFLF